MMTHDFNSQSLESTVLSLQWIKTSQNKQITEKAWKFLLSDTNDPCSAINFYISVSIVLIKHCDLKKVGEEEFISFYSIQLIFHHWGSQGRLKEGTWGRNRFKSCEGVLLTGFLLIAVSFRFLIQSRMNCPVLPPSTVIWAFLGKILF